ncbi:NeuD/PglB/VioB family sugar acetyltransferase [Fusobacterium sp. MFO224]|uniref:NeuD/PglB/VioB family sugar acetyltransferase n=1 Tax=Fusobacterium sp. MFO224 TaxID=3378070 RepID=UPI003853D163
MKNIVIIGAGGHAGMIIEIILKRKQIFNENLRIVGILIEDKYLESSGDYFMGFPILGNLSKINDFKRFDYEYIIGIGDNNARERIYNKYKELVYYTAIHPTAVISDNAKIGVGTVVGENSVMKNFSQLGNQCILNTLSLISHHCIVEDHSHIGPNSTLCGRVKVGEKCLIGAGSTLIPDINITKDVVVGAGTVVVNNISESSIVVGNPGKIIKTRGEK